MTFSTDAGSICFWHGFPEFWFAWRNHIAPLAAADYRVVAPDQRGYGLSAKPSVIGAYLLDTLEENVVALAGSLGHERFSVVGHDWGGIAAWQLAARFPRNVERTIVLNAPHPGTLFPRLLAPAPLRAQRLRRFFLAPVCQSWF